jgi:hypothetical protein
MKMMIIMIMIDDDGKKYQSDHYVLMMINKVKAGKSNNNDIDCEDKCDFCAYSDDDVNEDCESGDDVNEDNHNESGDDDL